MLLCKANQLKNELEDEKKKAEGAEIALTKLENQLADEKERSEEAKRELNKERSIVFNTF